MDQSQLKWIADIVTGQVDVRNWVPGPDDRVTDEGLAALDDTPDNEAIPEDNETEP